MRRILRLESKSKYSLKSIHIKVFSSTRDFLREFNAFETSTAPKLVTKSVNGLNIYFRSIILVIGVGRLGNSFR